MSDTLAFTNKSIDCSQELFAEIAIPAYVQQTYTYRIPQPLHPLAQRGCRALIQFGKKLHVGYIVALHDTVDGHLEIHKIKDIEELVDEAPIISEEILELAQWVADYYYAPWGEVLKTSLPPALNADPQIVLNLTENGRKQLKKLTEQNKTITTKQKFLKWLEDIGGTTLAESAPSEYTTSKVSVLVRELEKNGFITTRHQIRKKRVQPKRQNIVQLSNQFARSKNLLSTKLTPAQQKVLDILESVGAISFTSLTEKTGVGPSVIRTLAQKGILEISAREIRRDPLAYLKSLPRRAVSTLNDEQSAALIAISKIQHSKQYQCFLLQGVTGSGKTEVYLAAMQLALELGQSALMLVPEIGLTPMLARRLTERFGTLVAILHSSLSEGERLDEWERIREGEAQIVIGTRSAVFAPLVNLGLVIVDEEHDNSYKQGETPRYHGRDTAIVRAHKASCPIILGSATPAIESAYHSQSGKYVKLEMKNRFEGCSNIDIEIVDMRDVFKRQGKQQVFSDELLNAINETYVNSGQTIILLNRRGFSSFLICRSCGVRTQCPNCDVTLTYHKIQNKLVCHYCNYQALVPKQCSNCNGSFIYYVGEGTEQLEELLSSQFPNLKIARLDRDTTRRRGVFERTVNEFSSGSIDLIIGTQMIAKGHDFPNVTLVGVVSVDAGLGLPDFRAAERTFQLLTQVAGRAGRGDKTGRVILQTYHPEHYAIQCAQDNNYEKFYLREIQFRQQMFYPPFSVLANIIVHHKDISQASSIASRFCNYLRAAAQRDSTIRILGPSAAPLSKLRGEYRYQVLIKTRQRKKLREVLDFAFLYLAEEHSKPDKPIRHPLQHSESRFIAVEIDPVDLM